MSQPWQQQPTGDGGPGPQQGQPAPAQPQGFGAPHTPPPGFAAPPVPQQPAYGAPAGAPPQQAPGGYGQPAPAGYGGQPGAQPGAVGGQQGGYGYPAPGGAPGQAPGGEEEKSSGPPQNLWFALGAALVATVICIFAYGALFNAMTDLEAGETRQIGYVSLLVGVIVGAGPAFLAKRNWVAYGAGVLLAGVAIYLGTIFGLAMVANELQTLMLGSGDGAMSLFFGDMGELIELWNEGAEPMDWVFMAFAPLGAVIVAQGVLKREKQG
ncbi:hypothetical protein [Streptomyces lonarensis]|uniref:Uncharacterized protein n=1 Tax=Streptomyces lonarensis TaxID=700599 RepID=A0A7X6D3I6_9ACTN|nr:hypothetical protein [Streptomyces lonarensis]NJQ07509.1 hypothetical protein [Streptomyces lonarensis]